MNVNFIIYNNTGKILRTGICPADWLNLQPQTGEFVIEGTADAVTQKIDVDTRTVVSRLVNPAKLVGAELQDVPVGSTVIINNTSYPVTDSTVTLDFTYPGTYKILVTGWPYQDAKFEVTK